MDPTWKRIAGLATKEDGGVGVVWLTVDPENRSVTVWDCARWEREAFDIVARRITNTGRYTPVAWANKAYCEEMQNRGVRMLPDPVSVDPAVAMAKTTEVWELMRAKQFFAKRGLVDWVEEAKHFQREKGKIPLGQYPLMEATWYATSALQYARAEQSAGRSGPLFPKVAMV